MALDIRRGLSLTLIFFWTLFFVRIPQYESLTLWPVGSCPGNQSEVKAATLRLKCSDVSESINVYHCLPLSNLSELVEFCYDGRSGLVEAGNCMVLYRETLDNYPCRHFTHGCPNDNYFPKNMYKYPACLKINTQSDCYIADPYCSNVRFLETTTLVVETTLIEKENNPLQYLIQTLISLSLTWITIALVIVWYKRRKGNVSTKEKDTNEEPNETEFYERHLDLPFTPEDTSVEVEEPSSMIGDTPMNEDKQNESEDLHLRTEHDPMNEMHSYLENKDFLERYQKYLEEGSMEICPLSQIIIVGEHGVGKTTLRYRLQGRSRGEIESIRSTRGVECRTEQHSFINTKKQLEMNMKGVSSLAVDPGHVNKFFESKTKQQMLIIQCIE